MVSTLFIFMTVHSFEIERHMTAVDSTDHKQNLQGIQFLSKSFDLNQKLFQT